MSSVEKSLGALNQEGPAADEYGAEAIRAPCRDQDWAPSPRQLAWMRGRAAERI
jgi:hypothetical protein